MKKISCFIVLILCGVCWAVAQQAPNSSDAGIGNSEGNDPDRITVSLVTYYPGSAEYELYGHAGIKVGFADGSGIFYNYGIFDFNAPNFVYRFVKGETDYKVAGYDARYMLRGYDRRKVVEQVLNFSQEQARAAYEYLTVNALPWNATYRYNYVYDNCSTRPRDIIELASGGTVKYPAMRDTTTFRKMMHKYNANYSWSQFGIDISLGSGLDKTLDYREQMFVPMVLMEACARATMIRDGERVPLVAETIVLNEGNESGDVLPPTPWWATPMCMFCVLLLVVLAFTYRDLKRGKVTRWLDSAMYGMLSIEGFVLYFLIFVSTHEATSPNWNGVWMNPFYLIPAVLIWIKSAKTLLYCYHFVNFAVLIALLLGWYWVPQVANAAFFPLMLCSVLRSANYILIHRKRLNAK